jgi:hypothetical protein
MTKLTKKQLTNLRSLKVQLVQIFGAIASGNRYSEQEAFGIGDTLVKDLCGTAWTGLEDLLQAAKHGYRPSLYTHLDPRAEVLADLYDFFQAKRGVPFRAYRGS